MSLCTFGIYIDWVHPTVARYTKDSSSVGDRGVGGNRCSLPQTPKQCSTLYTFIYTSQSSFSKGYVSLYCWFQVSLLFCFAFMLLERKLQRTHFTCLLCSPLARAQYVILYDLKLVNKDSNLQVYIYCKHAHKEASEAPRTHFRACKISWRCALPQSILWGHFLYLPWAPPILLAALDSRHTATCV